MPRFSKESIQRLRDAVDIVDVITRYLSLKKSGSSYKACCPFHDEKTPSFIVTAGSNRFHCFGCGAHGDAVSFLMQHEKLSFTQALEFLSERYNIPLESVQVDPSQITRRRVKDVIEQAMLFFHTVLLFSKEAEGARAYLVARGISQTCVESFCLGYAPAGRSVVSQYLIAQGYTLEEIREAGLVSMHGGDFFQERIVFPIYDTGGSPIGFSARKWKEETFGGKYINSPDTLLFKKSKVLFGLFQAKKRIAQDRIACIVEGQMDALKLLEAGFGYTVATLGTAFGMTHIEQLRSFGVEHVYLAFDQDEAGLASCEKSGDLLMKHGIEVTVVRYKAKDPDELLTQQGAPAFLAALTSGIEYIDFVVQRAKQHSDWSALAHKDRAIKAIVETISHWESPIMRHDALKKLAAFAEVPEAMLLDGESPSAQVHTAIPSVMVTDSIRELDVLRWLIGASEDLFALYDVSLCAEDFTSELAREFFVCIMDSLRKGEPIDCMQYASLFEAEAIDEALAVLLTRKPIPEKKAIMETLQKMKNHSWLRARERIRQQMTEPHSEQELLALAQQFDELLKKAPRLTE